MYTYLILITKKYRVISAVLVFKFNLVRSKFKGRGYTEANALQEHRVGLLPGDRVISANDVGAFRARHNT
jgi:hypothetical protein